MNKVLITGIVAKKLPMTDKKVIEVTICPINDRAKEGTFIRAKAFNKVAEIINNNVQVKSRIAIIGHVQSDQYEKEGQKVYKLDIVIDELEFLEKKSSDTPQIPSKPFAEDEEEAEIEE